MYVFELSMRIIDYFFDKFLWAITEAHPYDEIEDEAKEMQLLIMNNEMDLKFIDSLDL